MSASRDRIRRGLSVAVALGIFATGGCCSIARFADACCKGDHLIVVMDKGVIQTKKVRISKSLGSQIVWKAAWLPATAALVPIESIDIMVGTGQKPPFTKCGSGSLCKIPCGPEGVCPSGPINPEVDPDLQNTYYEYAAKLVSGPGSDPGFIIKR